MTRQELPHQPRQVTNVTAFTAVVEVRLAADDGDAEIGEVGRAVVVEQHIRRLDVVVDHAGGVRRHQRACHFLHEPRHPRHRPGPAGDHRVTCGPAAEEPEHEERATRLPPEVVERDDVRMFETGDEAGLDLEPTDELGRVREIGSDRLDRDLPVGARLGRGVHPAVRTLTDRPQDRVAAQRSLVRELTRLVVGDDPRLEFDQFAGWLQAGLLGEPRPERPVDAERLGPPACDLERHHEEAHRSFTEWLCGNHGFEPGDGTPVVSDRDQRRGAALLCRVAALDQP